MGMTPAGPSDSARQVLALTATGFRPFFLLGAAWACFAVPFWLLVLVGSARLAGPLRGQAWHAHETIHGFTAAILAGFLLTAVRNWTGRETLSGPPLAGLALLWLAGRVALLAVPGWAGSLVDLAFLPAVAVAILRPLIAVGAWRNLVFPVLLLILWLANLATHLDAHGAWPGIGLQAGRFAVYVVAVIVLVVTGRIVPMFTRNSVGGAVASSRGFDALAIGAVAGVAVGQLLPMGNFEPLLSGVGALAVVGRSLQWGGERTLRTPLLWVLHVGHGFLAVGLALGAALPWLPAGRSPALHGITVGAIGMLTLGMMARVALGHTGRPLVVGPVMTAAFGGVGLAALVRVFGPLLIPAHATIALWVSALLWSAAFGGYVLAYARILWSPRPDGKSG